MCAWEAHYVLGRRKVCFGGRAPCAWEARCVPGRTPFVCLGGAQRVLGRHNVCLGGRTLCAWEDAHYVLWRHNMCAWEDMPTRDTHLVLERHMLRRHIVCLGGVFWNAGIIVCRSCGGLACAWGSGEERHMAAPMSTGRVLLRACVLPQGKRPWPAVDHERKLECARGRAPSRGGAAARQP